MANIMESQRKSISMTAAGVVEEDELNTSRNLKRELSKLVAISLRKSFPNDEVNTDPLIVPCINTTFGHYQCNNAMGMVVGAAGAHRRAAAQAIAKNLPPSEIIESTSVAGPGFVNIVISKEWMAKNIHRMLVEGIDTWAPRLPVKRAVVDFSSPNIAKEMHVGHLRSTIIGDTLAHMLEFSKVEVLRRNHLGDWGTQFGMLLEYLFERFPNIDDVSSQAIGDLQAFYRASRQQFDSDPEFKERARRAVVELQHGEPRHRQAWSQICDISRKEFSAIYARLGVQLEEKGESFYNPYIPDVIEELSKIELQEPRADLWGVLRGWSVRAIFINFLKFSRDYPSNFFKLIKRMGKFLIAPYSIRSWFRPWKKKMLVQESEGARVIKIDGSGLIIVKKDGGFNYDSTDLTALWYRLNVEKADWIIYVTDVGQEDHFDKIFKTAKLANWLPADENTFPKASHVGFGLVRGEDGKRYRTRSSEVVRLVDLLDTAIKKSTDALNERSETEDWSKEELVQIAEAIGYGSIKYADLKNNRLTDYTFNVDRMVKDKGDTAVYLLYAHARICSITMSSGKDMEELKKTTRLILDHADEQDLGLHLLRFSEVVEEACTDLLPHLLCEYLYNLSRTFTRFYTSCEVVKSEESSSRLLLCEATAIVMRKCFHLLGIVPLYRMPRPKRQSK